jgi:hypothetical protein
MPANNPQPNEEWAPNTPITSLVVRIVPPSEGNLYVEDGQTLVQFQGQRPGMLEVLPLSVFVERYHYQPPPVDLSAQIELNRELLRAQRERPVGREATRIALDHLRERIENPHNLLQLEQTTDQADPYTVRMMRGVEQTLNEAFGPPGPERDANIRGAIQRRTEQLTVERIAARLRDAPPLGVEERRIVDALAGSIRDVLELNDSLRGYPDRLERVRAEIAQRLLINYHESHNVVPQWIEDTVRGEVRAREDKLVEDTLREVLGPEPPKPTQWERLSQEDD